MSAALDELIVAIAKLDASDWKLIEDRTAPRIIATHYADEDTRSVRVACRSMVSNALLDIAQRP